MSVHYIFHFACVSEKVTAFVSLKIEAARFYETLVLYTKLYVVTFQRAVVIVQDSPPTYVILTSR